MTSTPHIRLDGEQAAEFANRLAALLQQQLGAQAQIEVIEQSEALQDPAKPVRDLNTTLAVASLGVATISALLAVPGAVLATRELLQDRGEARQRLQPVIALANEAEQQGVTALVEADGELRRINELSPDQLVDAIRIVVSPDDRL